MVSRWADVTSDSELDQVVTAATHGVFVCYGFAYVPNHGDLFCHLIDQIIRLNLAVKDSLRILRDSLRSLRTP